MNAFRAKKQNQIGAIEWKNHANANSILNSSNKLDHKTKLIWSLKKWLKTTRSLLAINTD